MRPFVMRLTIALALAVAGPVELLVVAPAPRTPRPAPPRNPIDADPDARTVANARAFTDPDLADADR